MSCSALKNIQNQHGSNSRDASLAAPHMDLIATHDPSNIPEPRYIYSVLYIQPSGEVWEGFAKEYKQVNPKWTIK